MTGSSKNNGENYPRKCFWTQEKETRVKFNPGLSANRPSNNWAQRFKGLENVSLVSICFPCSTWGSPIGFSGCRISLIWSSGFGIIKPNRERFGIESTREDQFRETCEGRGSAYPEGSRFQPFPGHMFRINLTSFGPCQTEENWEEYKPLSWFHGSRSSRYYRIYTDSSIYRLMKTIIQKSYRRIESIRRKIIRQRKKSMRPVASHFGFFAVIALYRNFILFKKVGRIVGFKTFKIFRLKYNSCILNYNL